MARCRRGGANPGAAARAVSDIAERAAALTGSALIDTRRMSGGSLSDVVWLRLADGRDLIAKHAASARAEAEMLHAIVATGAPAPNVVGVEDDLVVMAAVAAGGRLDGPAWASLVAALACLHVASGQAYGWTLDHAFGKVAIVNARFDVWPMFWAENRLRCHLPHIGADLARRVDRLSDRLGDLLPARPPSALLHGDLWGGNVLVDAGRVSALIDPACYYGDREVDVAMLTLFDSPPSTFFDALGLDIGWRDRLPIYRLWPLLVHLRLFGSGYASRVSDALDQLRA